MANNDFIRIYSRCLIISLIVLLNNNTCKCQLADISSSIDSTDSILVKMQLSFGSLTSVNIFFSNGKNFHIKRTKQILQSRHVSTNSVYTHELLFADFEKMDSNGRHYTELYIQYRYHYFFKRDIVHAAHVLLYFHENYKYILLQDHRLPNSNVRKVDVLNINNPIRLL